MARRGLMPFACWSDKSPKGQKKRSNERRQDSRGQGVGDAHCDLSGYIFGRVRVSNELAPAGNNPGQNNPARGPNANPGRQRKQVRIGFGNFPTCP
jgi:hypothetical protein